MKRKIASVTAFLLASAMLLSACAEQPAEGADDTASETTAVETTAAENVQTEPAETLPYTTVTENENVNIPDPTTIAFSAASGFYAEEFDLMITAEEEGEIFYTLDGSNPATSDTAIAYTEPVKIVSAEGRENVVSAVDPILFSANYNRLTKNFHSGKMI